MLKAKLKSEQKYKPSLLLDAPDNYKVKAKLVYTYEPVVQEQSLLLLKPQQLPDANTRRSV